MHIVVTFFSPKLVGPMQKLNTLIPKSRNGLVHNIYPFDVKSNKNRFRRSTNDVTIDI